MPTIIRDRFAVSVAHMDDLNHTYRELKGEPDFKGFTSRAAAEVQVQMAIMAAQDAAGHLGVPKRSKPTATTAQELAAAAESKNPYKEGTMSHKLHKAIQQQTPITPRAEKKDDQPVARRVKIQRVRYVPGGTSRPQAGSLRNEVLQYCAEKKGVVAVEELEAHFNIPVRGYLQKLIEKGHLVIIEDEA